MTQEENKTLESAATPDADEEKSKVPYADILQNISQTKFTEIFNAAPRSSRQIMIKRLGVRKKSTISMRKAKQAKLEQEQKLHAAFLEQGDHELAEQLIRNWLYPKREMLAAALDYMKIPHTDGLTDEELTPFEELDQSGTQELQEHLNASFPAEDVFVYLRFLDVKHVTAPAAV